MINTFYANTSYVSQRSEISSFENSNNRNASGTANEALLGRLATNVPELKTGDVADLAANDFSPEKIAERISNFVAQGLQNARNEGRSEAEIQQKYEAAVAGVQKGFDEAREILGNLNFLTDDISSMIDNTEDLTFKALDGINPANSSNTPSISAYQTQAAAVERFASAETFSLDLKTQDGDTVKIVFANQSQQSSAFAYSEDDSGNYSALYQLSQSQSSSFQFQVQGDLDEGELAAITHLISDVTEISNEFFNGDVQKAFDSASQFQLDKTELSSINLQLKKSQEYSAASSYRTVQNNSASPAAKLGGHFINNFDQAIQQPTLDFLQDIQKVSQKLLDSLVKQDDRYHKADNKQKDIFNDSLDNIKNIIESMQDTALATPKVDV
ncbi:DUF5610 domain-containing protein [Gammaproteobacteria bacterium AS21]